MPKAKSQMRCGQSQSLSSFKCLITNLLQTKPNPLVDYVTKLGSSAMGIVYLKNSSTFKTGQKGVTELDSALWAGYPLAFLTQFPGDTEGSTALNKSLRCFNIFSVLKSRAQGPLGLKIYSFEFFMERFVRRNDTLRHSILHPD